MFGCLARLMAGYFNAGQCKAAAIARQMSQLQTEGNNPEVIRIFLECLVEGVSCCIDCTDELDWESEKGRKGIVLDQGKHRSHAEITKSRGGRNQIARYSHQFMYGRGISSINQGQMY